MAVAPASLPPSGSAADVDALAAYLVDCGRVVPGLTVEPDGRARSWWWPLPVAADRELVAALVADGDVESHVAAAALLGERVDAEMRARVVASGATLRPGPGSDDPVDAAWARALCSPDPWLEPGVDEAGVRELAEIAAAWVREGAVPMSGVRLCLRVHEPPEPEEGAEEAEPRWTVELLAQDADEPSLLVPAADVWAGEAALGPDAATDLLAALGRLPRLAPELAGMLDEAAPAAIELDTETFAAFARERIGPLADADIAVLLPSWWSSRRRPGLRARTSKAPSGAVVSGGVGLDAMVAFTWEAALGDEVLTPADVDALQRAAAAKRPLVRLRGQWVVVEATDEIDRMLARAGTAGSASAADLLRAGLGLPGTGLEADGELLGVAAGGWLGALLDDALHAQVTPVADPPGFAGELRPYQQRGVGWLAFLGSLGLGACLADDMGLGKTAQLIGTVLADPAPGPTLVVCPVSVLGNWERELARFAPELRVLVHHGPARLRGHDEPLAARVAAVDVVLTTYALVARDVDALGALEWGRVVLDEAQQIKNANTKQARAVRRLRAARRVALTGTPVENRLAELWSLMQVLNPGLLGTLKEFRERFAIPIERFDDDDAAGLLRRITGPFLLRRLKTDRAIIDDLPEKIEQTEHTPLTREQATLYQAVVDDVIAQLSGAEDDRDGRGIVLAGLVKLKQVCNHPALFLHDGSALPNRSGKLTRVEELLDEIVDAGDRVLCFTQFAEWGTLLVPHLTRRYGREPLWLHGGVTRAQREELIAAFAAPDGPPIFLLSLRAGGTGLNLTAASHVIHLDRWWNPAVEDQATDRAYRIGQRRSVLVHKLVSMGTVEERIDAMIASKRALAQRVVGTGEDWITRLDVDELREVLALRDPGTDD